MDLTKKQFDILEAFATSQTILTGRELEKITHHSLEDINQTVKELTDAGYISKGSITSFGINALEPYRAKRAIFIAAGFGTRLAPITFNTPKPLVRVHGVRIIDRLIDACLEAGINEIYIVRGYLAEQFDQLLYKYPMIKFLENPVYNEANNISSSFVARYMLSNAYVFEADLLISNPGIIKRYHYTSDFLAIRKERTDDWCFTVKDGIITEEKVGGAGNNIWQMVGISYWNEADGHRLSQDIADVYASPGGKERYWEQVPLVYAKDRYVVEVRECFSEDIVEIDTFRELRAIDKTYDVGRENQREPIKRKILLNPGPSTTTNTVKYAQVVPDICPREKEFGRLMAGLREDLVRIVHGDLGKYTSVLFCGSGTINIDVCINSLLPEGKKVLIVNNGAYSARAVEICRYYGLPHIDLRFPVDQRPDLAVVEETLKTNPDIGLVHTTHNETGTGILNPIREIGALSHKYGAIFSVDTTSTYAMRPIDIEKDNIDFCMASAQKGLMAFTGLSFVVGNRRIIEESANYPRRSYYCNLFLQYDFFEKTGEMHFTPPVQTIYATIQALREYWAEGEEAKWARHTRVFHAINAGLDELGFRQVIKPEWRAGLVSSAVYPDDPNWSFEAVHDYCYERGFTIYPGKISATNTFRLCALGAIDEGDMKDFFVVFKEALLSTGVQIPVRYKG